MWNHALYSECCHQHSFDKPHDHQCSLENKPYDYPIQEDEKNGGIFFWLFLIPYIVLLLI